MTTVNNVSPADYQAMMQQAQPMPEQDMGGYAAMPADAYAYEEIPQEKKSMPWLKIGAGLAAAAGLFYLGRRTAGSKEVVGEIEEGLKKAVEEGKSKIEELTKDLATINSKLNYEKIAKDKVEKEKAAALEALKNIEEKADNAVKFKLFNPKTWGASSLAKKVKGFIEKFNKEKIVIEEDAKKAKEALDKKVAEEAKKAAEGAGKAAEGAGKAAEGAAEGGEVVESFLVK